MGKIILNGVDYSAANIRQDIPLATTSKNGLMSANDKNIVENALSYNGDIVYMKEYGGICFDDDSDTYNGYRSQNTVRADYVKLQSTHYLEDNDNNVYEAGYESVEFNINGITKEGDSLQFRLNNQSIYFDDSFYSTSLMDLGKSNSKWRNIYATNGTIQTSDRTRKTDINNLETQKAQAFINGLNPVSYKMVDGTSGRTHYGLIAQDIEKLMNTLNMDSSDFAGFIKSPKKITKYEDENGKKLKKPIEEVIEGEYDYSLRYDEFIAPLIKVVQEQQKEIEKLKEMIAI